MDTVTGVTQEEYERASRQHEANMTYSSRSNVNIYQHTRRPLNVTINGRRTSNYLMDSASAAPHEDAFKIIEHPTLSTSEKVKRFNELASKNDLKIMAHRSKDDHKSLMSAAAAVKNKHPELYDAVMSQSSIVKGVRAQRQSNRPKPDQLAFDRQPSLKERMTLTRGAPKRLRKPDSAYVSQAMADLDINRPDMSELADRLFEKRYSVPQLPSFLTSSARYENPAVEKQDASDMHARLMRTLMESPHMSSEEKQTILKTGARSPYFDPEHKLKDGASLNDVVNEPNAKKILASFNNAKKSENDELTFKQHADAFYNSFGRCGNEFVQLYNTIENPEITEDKKLKAIDKAVGNGLSIRQRMQDGSHLLQASSKGSAVFNKLTGIYRDEFKKFRNQTPGDKMTPSSAKKNSSSSSTRVDSNKLEQTRKLHDAVHDRDIEKCAKYIKAGACPHLVIDGDSAMSIRSEINPIPFTKKFDALVKDIPAPMFKTGMHCFKKAVHKVEEAMSDDDDTGTGTDTDTGDEGILSEVESDIEEGIKNVTEGIEDVIDDIKRPFKSNGCSGKKGKKSKNYNMI